MTISIDDGPRRRGRHRGHELSTFGRVAFPSDDKNEDALNKLETRVNERKRRDESKDVSVADRSASLVSATFPAGQPTDRTVVAWTDKLSRRSRLG